MRQPSPPSSPIEFQDEDRFVRREPETLADQFIGRALLGMSAVLILVLMLGGEARFPQHLRLGLFDTPGTTTMVASNPS
jgi:hypothetical protein